jgi:hypothetical protein
LLFIIPLSFCNHLCRYQRIANDYRRMTGDC